MGCGWARHAARAEREHKEGRRISTEVPVCGLRLLLPPGYQVDHIQPLALGGTNGLSNLQALCVRCHARKTRGQRRKIQHGRVPRVRQTSPRHSSAAASQDALRSVGCSPWASKSTLSRHRLSHFCGA